jgi:hypothetical protein
MNKEMFENIEEDLILKDEINCLNENNKKNKFDLEEYIMIKMKLKSKLINNISILRRMYKDYDIGIKEFELNKVIKGKRWYNKSSRKK